MSIKKGTDLGGINSLERLRERCVLDTATGCWHYRGAARTVAGQCECWIIMPDGQRRRFTGRRAALVLSGVKIPAGQRAYQSVCCPSADCCAPAHSSVGTMRDATAAASLRGCYETPGRIARLNVFSQAAAKLSEQDRIAIATSSRPQDEDVQRYGITRGYVNKLRRGEFGRKPERAASVFAWRPA
jgi:hypothetical protein